MDVESGCMVHHRLKFPSNVFAHILFLKFGHVDSLHYGVWQDGCLDLEMAQKCSSEMFLQNMPTPPCEILEIVDGMDSTSDFLSSRGYAVTTIASDSLLYNSRKKPNSGITEERVSSFAAFHSDDKRFDLLLLNGSCQFQDPLELFQNANSVLVSHGKIVILDEFEIRRTAAEPRTFHLLDHFLAQAARWGFRVEKNIDLTARALPTIDFFLQGLIDYQCQLLDDLALSLEQYDQLNQSLQNRRQKYLAGLYGYVFLSLIKDDKSLWQITELQENDEVDLRCLFKQVFGHEMSSELWRWKYEEGRGVAIVGRKNAQLLSHYGGIFRDVLFKGDRRRELQIADVMVAPSERGAFTRNGLFLLTAATFLERYIGYGSDSLVGFGFPNARHMRLAQLHGLYSEIDTMKLVRWQPAVKIARLFTKLEMLTEGRLKKQTAAINDLWQRMASDLTKAIVGVRDVSFLKHRYFEHPERTYEVVQIKNRFGDALRGILVLRKEEKSCFLVDIVGALADIPLFVYQARRLSALWQKEFLYTWITASHVANFAVQKYQIEDLDISIPMNIWTPSLGPDDVREMWWLMPGDTDFQ